MNDFLNKLGAVAKNVANAAGTELNIAVHEQRLRENYQALGKLYYHYVSSGLLPEGEAFDEKMAAVTAELNQIRELRSQKAAE